MADSRNGVPSSLAVDKTVARVKQFKRQEKPRYHSQFDLMLVSLNAWQETVDAGHKGAVADNLLSLATLSDFLWYCGAFAATVTSITKSDRSYGRLMKTYRFFENHEAAKQAKTLFRKVNEAGHGPIDIQKTMMDFIIIDSFLDDNFQLKRKRGTLHFDSTEWDQLVREYHKRLLYEKVDVDKRVKEAETYESPSESCEDEEQLRREPKKKKAKKTKFHKTNVAMSCPYCPKSFYVTAQALECHYVSSLVVDGTISPNATVDPKCIGQFRSKQFYRLWKEHVKTHKDEPFHKLKMMQKVKKGPRDVKDPYVLVDLTVDETDVRDVGDNRAAAKEHFSLSYRYRMRDGKRSVTAAFKELLEAMTEEFDEDNFDYDAALKEHLEVLMIYCPHDNGWKLKREDFDSRLTKARAKCMEFVHCGNHNDLRTFLSFIRTLHVMYGLTQDDLEDSYAKGTVMDNIAWNQTRYWRAAARDEDLEDVDLPLMQYLEETVEIVNPPAVDTVERRRAHLSKCPPIPLLFVLKQTYEYELMNPFGFQFFEFIYT